MLDLVDARCGLLREDRCEALEVLAVKVIDTLTS